MLRVAAIRVPVKRLSESLPYYADMLGLRLVREDSVHGTAVPHAELPLGLYLEIVETGMPPSPYMFRLRGGHIQPFIRIHVSVLDGMYQGLRSGEYG